MNTGPLRPKRILRWTLGTLGAAFVVLQLLPIGGAHTNPPVLGEPPWDAPRTRELFFRTCGDCHSNETRWPWYSHVAPVSWLVRADVRDGRSHLNVSEWSRPQKDAEEAAEAVQEGEMPLPIYLVTHPEARLGPTEQAELVAGLEATFGSERRGRDRKEGKKGREPDDDDRH